MGPRLGSMGLLGSGPPPSLDAIFGPTAGAPAVRAGAGPLAVTDPGGGTTFTTRADLAAKIASGGVNDIFVHAAGGSEAWSPGITVPSGKAPRIYFLGLAGSTATVLTGGAASSPGVQFSSAASPGVRGEVHGGTWQNFGDLTSELWMGAIVTRQSCLVEDVVIHDGMNGIGYDGTGSTAATKGVRYNRCYVYNSLKYGLSAGSPNATTYSPIPEISYCHWKNCNLGNFSPAGDSGGTKFLTYSPWIHHNWAEGNNGSGIWTDYSWNRTLIEENVVENNNGWGIFFEVGNAHSWLGTMCLDAKIRHNALYNNALSMPGGAGSWFNSVQLLVSCTDGQINGGTGFEVANNIVDGAALAMGFVDHNFHPFDVKSGLWHDNDIWLRGTGTGKVGGELITGGTQPQGDPFSAPSNNHFEDNRYHVSDLGIAKWRWAGANKTWAQWQALGHDNTGSLLGDA